MVKKVTIKDIEWVVGFKISDHCKQLIEEFDLKFRFPTEEERDGIILDILNALDSDLEKAGKHKLEKWEKGWYENLELLKENPKVSSLVPKYFGKHQIARWGGEFVVALTDYFDYKLHIILVDAILNKYVGINYENLWEFGCGPAYHLLRFREFNPNINLVGLDWAESSQNIINEIKKLGITDQIEGYNFDYFNPDYNIEIPSNSAVFTCASLEQMHVYYSDFVDYLLKKKPDLVINFEPMAELLNENNLVDRLSTLYFKKRNYLEDYLGYLKVLEEEGKIEILLKKRLWGGSYFIEGYPVVIWRPIK